MKKCGKKCVFERKIVAFLAFQEWKVGAMDQKESCRQNVILPNSSMIPVEVSHEVR